MAKTVYDKLMQDEEFRKYYQREELMSEITLVIYQTMKSKSLTQKKLAEMAGVSKGRISQILSGNYNITVSTISDLLFALDAKINITVEHLTHQEMWESKEAIVPKSAKAEPETVPPLKIVPPLKLAG